MVEEMVKSVLLKTLTTDFPFLQLPDFMKARVTRATEIGEWYEYNLKILDKTGVIDERFPEIPGVLSKVYVEAGKTVAVGLLYGELNPYIIGEVV
jgi:hypothetical protein